MKNDALGTGNPLTGRSTLAIFEISTCDPSIYSKDHPDSYCIRLYGKVHWSLKCSDWELLPKICESGPEVINFFSCSTQLSTKFQLFIKKLKYRQIKNFLALSLSDIVYIMLINIWHFNIYEQDLFRAQLSWAWKQFYNLGARPTFSDFFFQNPSFNYLHALYNFVCFLSSQLIFTPFKHTIRASYSLYPNQARRFVEFNLGPNCLQRQKPLAKKWTVRFPHLLHRGLFVCQGSDRPNPRFSTKPPRVSYKPTRAVAFNRFLWLFL